MKVSFLQRRRSLPNSLLNTENLLKASQEAQYNWRGNELHIKNKRQMQIKIYTLTEGTFFQQW